MKKTFNVNGTCYPDENYMVNLDSRLKQIKDMISQGKYFVINRARQYGKTTTLCMLKEYLNNEYIVLSLDFQKMSSSSFQNEYVFASSFLHSILKNVHNKRRKITGLDFENISIMKTALEQKEAIDLPKLFDYLSSLCDTAKQPVVLMIDEVDSASCYQVFLDFLAQLRAFYLSRKETPAFQSVILAGIYDIKNLKLKLRPNQEHKYNSPWNIAADFKIDMSFSEQDIEGMLLEYEKDYQTGMDTAFVSGIIYEYTAGYPYMVSRICQILDEQIVNNNRFNSLSDVWTKNGIIEAVKVLLCESNTLFDDVKKKLTDFSDLRAVLYEILFNGKKYPYNPYNEIIDIGVMFGFLKEEEGVTIISNRIFETWMYNLFLSEEVINSAFYNKALLDKAQMINDGQLDMELILKKFTEHFTEVYADSDIKFVEENGRRIFLLYLKPIINGIGNYYIEARTRDLRRTDVIIDYCGNQYIIEMKIWHGREYNLRGEHQLSEYLDYYHLKKGYMLSFNFDKKKTVGMKTIQFGDKMIVEAII